MNKHNAVGVKVADTGEITICARGYVACFHTLCGNSLNDGDMIEVPIAVNAKIDCVRCREIWRIATSFKASAFK